MRKIYLSFFLLLSLTTWSKGKTVARQFMETALIMVELDGQGPTIHARNLFHTSAVMYDVWAIYHSEARPYLLGSKKGEFQSNFDLSFVIPDSLNTKENLNQAIAYAAYRLLRYRFNLFGSKGRTLDPLDETFWSLGYDDGQTGMDYRSGEPAQIGNYVAQQYIDFGLLDGSNEEDEYETQYYNPVNEPLNLTKSGNHKLRNKNRWQPVVMKDYAAKKGNDPTLNFWQQLILVNQEFFLSPEWGEVIPFALDSSDLKILNRENSLYKVYLDPGQPPQFSPNPFGKEELDDYRWEFIFVLKQSALLDPSDSVKIDISPASKGNDSAWEKEKYRNYYDSLRDGRSGKGHKVNPKTKKPYEPNWVYRGDYLRVIAEYWVDGIATPGPPGHWFNLLLDISDSEDFKPKWEGKGVDLSPIEWDIKSMFTLGGALHDAAIAAWSVKGYYDYIRPISAIRYMASMGQCSDTSLANFHPHGIPLIKGLTALVDENDPLAGPENENLGKVKAYCWRGPDYVNDAEDFAGVGWILAENWWPYQRYSFVTPPFAGYVSGHSTFSMAGAEVLTRITGDPFFPGGLGEIEVEQGSFLEFENGPARAFKLQWASYRDAATETCLSRIWGGIHPPCDDFNGRLMGEQIGMKAVEKSRYYFNQNR